jgi:hypothetical protein
MLWCCCHGQVACLLVCPRTVLFVVVCVKSLSGIGTVLIVIFVCVRVNSEKHSGHYVYHLF